MFYSAKKSTTNLPDPFSVMVFWVSSKLISFCIMVYYLTFILSSWVCSLLVSCTFRLRVCLCPLYPPLCVCVYVCLCESLRLVLFPCSPLLITFIYVSPNCHVSPLTLLSLSVRCSLALSTLLSHPVIFWIHLIFLSVLSSQFLYAMLWVSLCLSVSRFILTVLRYMFNVFSFASFVSLCLICLSWVPYVFPVPSSFLVYLNPLFPSVHCYHLLQSLMAVCLPVYLVILVCVISGPAIKLISEWILTSVSLRLGPIPACITWLFMIFSVYSTTQLLE